MNPNRATPPDGVSEPYDREDEPLHEDRILAHLATERIAHPLVVLEEVDSTNLFLARKSDQLPDGTVVVTELQTAGRGRHGRRWFSPRGKNLMFSLLLRFPSLPASILTLMGALAVVRVVRVRTRRPLGIKWPNDIVALSATDNAAVPKVGGVLCETKADGHGHTAFILGIGVNVNSKVEELPQSADRPALSLAALSESFWDRNLLLAEILNEVESLSRTGEKDGIETLLGMAKEVCDTLGKQVRMVIGDREIEAEAVDLDPTGSLVLRGGDGKVFSVGSGEVLQTREIN